MPRARLIALGTIALAVALFAGGLADAVWAQTPGVEELSRAERMRRFRALPPEERGRILEDFQRWNDLSATRRQELQQAYDRFQRLPPERRERILERHRQFQALPPHEKERVLQNFERWQKLTPEERRALREKHRRGRSDAPPPR